MVTKTTIHLPDGLADRAHDLGINISGFVTRVLKKEVERLEQEDKR